MHLCCLDLEGVLLPEIWINVADRFKVKELRLTTRDIPDYDELMKYRLRILKKEGIRLKDIQKVIAGMKPLPGAAAFIKHLRQIHPVIILSDTFYEFATPLMKKIGNPTLFCHWLKVNKAGFITGYQLRARDSKRKAVLAFKKLGFGVIASGDSYNDISMLKTADRGILFRPPASIAKQFPQFPVCSQYAALIKHLRKS
ncbi:MAG: bifunctional phosphoserine phosphatase/homoserine phosphotransferase ThrH [Candidatus Omnitrophica bacterium]|nr:bifunctional phosphoserine phosphatase/homoserine phosphotransferase ThrH [Candidatus Omnitrophota bacterium]